MDGQIKAVIVLLFIWVFVNTVFTCAVVKYEIDKAERQLRSDHRDISHATEWKLRDLDHDLESIKKSLEELRDSLTEDNEDTMVSIKDVIATLEKMREV